MQTIEKENLKSQIEYAAEQLIQSDGADLAESLIAICSALLKTVDRICAEEGSDCITEEVYASYLGAAAWIKKFYERMMERQESVNAELFSDVAAQEERLQELKSQQEELEKEKKASMENLNKIEREIDVIPERNRMLVDQFKELEKLLAELREAETACSPEKQKELQDMIEELLPVIADNEEKTERLQNRMESLRQQKSASDEAGEKTAAELMTLVGWSLEDLGSVLKEQEETRAAAQKLEEFWRQWEEYNVWHDALLDTPFGAMFKNREYPENEGLRKTLDEGKVSSIEEKLKDVHENLDALDGLLAECVEVVGEDLKQVKKRAGQRA